ncbi:MAG: hypothetical protein AAGA23_16355 [Pseudomonadota bacterium]
MAGDRYGLIQTQVGRRAERIFPVQVYQIDGKEVRDDRTLHRLPPGEHTLKARGLVNRDLVPGVSRDASRGGPQEITIQVQSGYRYFLGLKADGPRRADWELIVWKIEETKAGMVSLDQ